jgi:hypothetical protein
MKNRSFIRVLQRTRDGADHGGRGRLRSLTDQRGEWRNMPDQIGEMEKLERSDKGGGEA